MKTERILSRANHIQVCIQNALYGNDNHMGAEGWADAIGGTYSDEGTDSSPAIALGLHDCLQKAAALCERLQTRMF